MGGQKQTIEPYDQGAHDAKRASHHPDARWGLPYARHEAGRWWPVAGGDLLHGRWRHPAGDDRHGAAACRRRLPRAAAGPLLSLRTLRPVRAQRGVRGRLPRDPRSADGHDRQRQGRRRYGCLARLPRHARRRRGPQGRRGRLLHGRRHGAGRGGNLSPSASRRSQASTEAIWRPTRRQAPICSRQS